MRIAVTSQGKDLEAEVDSRFGRTPGFLMIDPENMSFRIIKNSQNLDLAQGAGIQSAMNIARHKPDVVLTGNCGPKAFEVLQAAGIEVVLGVKGAIGNAVRDYLEGRFQPSKGANVTGHWV